MKFQHLSNTKNRILLLLAVLGLSFNQLYTQCDPDVTPPEIECILSHFILTCDGDFTYNSLFINPQSYSDNCATQAELLITNDYNNSNSLFGAVFPYGQHVVTWTVTETTGSQLSSTCTMNIIVTESLFPDCPYNTSRYIGQACTYEVNGAEFDASGISHCGPVTVTNDYNNSNTLAGEELPPGITTITWTIQGAGGDQKECTLSIHVVSSSTAVCQNATVELEENGLVSIEPSDVDNGSYDCDGYSLQVSPMQFSCDDLGGNPVTLTLSESGNTVSSCIASVTVTDPNSHCCAPPVALCQDITTQLNQDGNVSFGFFDINNGSIIDCTLSGSEITNTSLHCSDIGPNIVSMILTDVNGATSSCTATVTVEDNLKPTISCPSDFIHGNNSGDCGANITIPAALSYEDNCGVTFLKARVRPIVDGVAGAWGSFQDDPSGFYDVGNYEVQWRAKDASDNKKNCTFNFEVIDNEAPEVACNDVTLSFNGETTLDLIGDELLDELNSIDNCSDIQWIDIDKVSASCDEVGSTAIVKLTVEDEVGNTNICHATVEIGGLPCAWSHTADGIGCSNGNDGNYDAQSETFSVTSNGCYNPSHYRSTDAHGFVQHELCGDGEIIAHVVNIDGAGWAGISMRESNDPAAKMIQLMVNNSGLARRELRTSTGGIAFSHLFGNSGQYWLRLTRSNNSFAAHLSLDGISWNIVFLTNITMANCIQVGLITMNDSSNGIVTGTFDNVDIKPGIFPLATANPGFDIAVTEFEHEQGFNIFPNPTKGQINIRFEGFEDQSGTLTIYNKLGQRILTEQINNMQFNSRQLNLGDLTPGTYFLEIQSKGFKQSKRFIMLSD